MTKAFIACLLVLFAIVPAWAVPFVNIDKLAAEIGWRWLPAAEDFPEADAVILYEKHDVEIKFDNNWDVYQIDDVHIVQRLFKNIDEYSVIKIDVPEGEKLEKIDARTIKSDGKKIKLKKKEIYTITEKGEYYTGKTYKFAFPDIDKGSIIEYRYVITKDRAFFRDRWNIQHYIPTIKNLYSLTLPRMLVVKYDWKWLYKVYNYEGFQAPVVDQPDLIETGRNTKIRFIWNLSNIPAFEPEPSMPSHNIYRSLVNFTPDYWKKWNDISQWYYGKVFLPQLTESKLVKQISDSVVTGATDEYQKAVKLADYVKNIRYVSIDLGEGGYRPATPQKVAERQYGDCKDKSTLLIALLKNIGIEAQPILVLTDHAGRIDPSFPNWNFNHVIVKTKLANGSEYWIDPTAKYCRFGDLPSMDEGIHVMVINKDSTASIEKTPLSSKTDNQREVNIKMVLDTDDNVNFHVNIKYHGKDAVRYRYYLSELTDKKLEEFCKSLIIGEFVTASITKYNCQNIDSLDKTLELNFEFSANNAIQRQGDLYILNFDPYKLFENYEWLNKKTRKYPLDFGYPFTIRKKIDIVYPAGKYEIRNQPADFIKMDAGLKYTRNYVKSGPGALTVNESFSVENKIIGEYHYPEVLSFFEKAQNKRNEKIIFSRKI